MRAAGRCATLSRVDNCRHSHRDGANGMTIEIPPAADMRQRAFRLVLQSLGVDADMRERWLEEQLANTSELRDEVQLLLEIDRREFAVLDQPRAPVADPLADLRIGSRIGRFLIQARIAAGGMGVVYRAL